MFFNISIVRQMFWLFNGRWAVLETLFFNHSLIKMRDAIESKNVTSICWRKLLYKKLLDTSINGYLNKISLSSHRLCASLTFCTKLSLLKPRSPLTLSVFNCSTTNVRIISIVVLFTCILDCPLLFCCIFMEMDLNHNILDYSSN